MERNPTEYGSAEAGAFLAIWSDVPPERETDYLHWLTREHTAERLSVSGFLAVRVYRSLDGEIGRYFILYELTSTDVLTSAAYVARLNEPTPWSRRIMPILGNFIRGGGRVMARAGEGRGGVLAAIRLDPRAEIVNRDRLEKIVSMDRIVAARLLETDIDGTTLRTREKAMRAGDDTFPGLLLIEGTDAVDVANAARDWSGDRVELFQEIFQR